MRIVSNKTGVEAAVRFLLEKGVVAYPTETFYGLGVDAQDPEAIAALSRLKGRPLHQPFPILIPSRCMLAQVVPLIPPEAEKLMDRYWPGPLTLVLQSHNFPLELMNDQGGVGFRMTKHALAAELVNTFAKCLTSTSANLSGHRPATKAEEVAHMFPDADLLLLDGGSTCGGAASTVVDFSQSEIPVLIREGVVPWAELVKILGLPKTDFR